MSDTFDRDAARKVLRRWNGWIGTATEDNALNALEACVRTAPQQTIDRDVLVWHIREVVRSEREQYATSEEVVDNILALLRSVDGVFLTR